MKSIIRLCMLFVFAFLSCASSASGQEATGSVKVILTVFSPGQPSRATLFLASNYNKWNPAKDSLETITRRLHRIILDLPRGYKLEYKYTRGDWESVETDSAYVPISNRILLCDHPQTTRDTVSTWSDQLIDSTCINREMADCPITLGKAIDDANFYFRILQETHPQLLANITPEGYLRLRQSVCDTLSSLATKGILRRCHLCRILAEADASFKDAHTSLGNPAAMLSSLDSIGTLPPFTVRCDGGTFRINRIVTAHQDLLGAEVVQVNGTRFTDFIQPALKHISAETVTQKLQFFSSGQPTYWRLVPIPAQEDLSILVRDSAGITRTIALRPISSQAYHGLYRDQSRQLPSSSFAFYDKARICYFCYQSFDYSAGQMRLVDSLFQLVRTNNTRTLIIDLRDNGGGNSRMGDYLFNYLTSKPYCQSSRTDIKLSEYSIKRRFRQYKSLKGLLITEWTELREPEDKGFKFNGKLIVLTSSRTFSSAALFAHTVKDFHLGTIIGEETGGLRESFGDVLAFYTPNYGVFFLCSYKKFYAPVPTPTDLQHGTLPDITITDATSRDYWGSNDPTLRFVLDYARKN